MAGGSKMRVWRLGVALLLAGMAAACGGNSTAVGVIVTAPGITTGSTATVVTNGTLQFAATVTGASATTVFWRICLPAAQPTIQPTNCTPVPSTASNLGTVPTTTGTGPTGYGTVTQTGLYTAPPTPPNPNSFVVMAISTISPYLNETGQVTNSYFGIANVQIDSGVRVQVTPSTATIAAGETLKFSATVTGTSNQGVSWLVEWYRRGKFVDGLDRSQRKLYGPHHNPGRHRDDHGNGRRGSDEIGHRNGDGIGGVGCDPHEHGPDHNLSGIGAAECLSYRFEFLHDRHGFCGCSGAGRNRGANDVYQRDATAGGNSGEPCWRRQDKIKFPCCGTTAAPTLPDHSPSTLRRCARPSWRSSPDSVPQNPNSSPNVTLTGGYFTPSATTVHF